uniref:Chemotaxis signal transduction protein n=1 Tax=Burkholderia pseudomallei TaxID=28450 RepID=A3FIJ1_BURPE|nr:chemotaxis signal transduction protein [Burkholderia pseudomallei]
MIIRASSRPRPSTYSARIAAPSAGAGRIWSRLNTTTSDTPSTTIPTVLPDTLRMIVTVVPPYCASPNPNFPRKSMTGTMLPRRLMTPLM